MADLKISQLSDGGNSQATDEYVIARSGANYRIDGASIAAAATSVGTLSSLTVSGGATFASSTGNVGIGTTSPADTGGFGKALDIQSATGGQILIRDSDDTTRYARFAYDGTDNSGWVEATGTGSSLRFRTAGSQKMLLDASGNLGLGVTPSAWDTTYKAMELGRVGNTVAGYNGGTEINIAANAYYSGGWKYAVSTLATKYTTDNSGKHMWYTAASGTAGNAITFTQAMTLSASGILSVTATSGTGGQINLFGDAQTTGEVTLGQGFALATDDIGYLYNRSNAAFVFGTNNTERARITSGGYFKASNDGTYPSPTGSSHELVNNANGSTLASLTHKGSDPYGTLLVFSTASPDNNSNYFAKYEDSTTLRCVIWSDGDLANHDGVYGTISDERLKQDIVDAGSQWDDIKAVRFRKYRMKTDVAADENAPYQLGVIAQELEQTSPGLVDEHPDKDADGNDLGTTTKTVKSSILLMKAAVALQEAMARIEALEARLEALEA